MDGRVAALAVILITVGANLLVLRYVAGVAFAGESLFKKPDCETCLYRCGNASLPSRVFGVFTKGIFLRQDAGPRDRIR